MASTTTDVDVDDVDQVEEFTAFHRDLLDTVKLFYRHDKTTGSSPSKKLVDYVKLAPKYGLEKSLAELRSHLERIYQKHRDDILASYDDWIFKPDPLLLKVTGKIYLPIGNIYSRAAESQWDALYGSLLRTLWHVAPVGDRLKLTELAGAKEQKGAEGEGGLMSMISGLLGSGGGDGLGSLVKDITDKLGGDTLDPANPDSIDASKIGDLVKGLMTDQGEGSLVSKLMNNPALASMAEKMKGGGLGLPSA